MSVSVYCLGAGAGSTGAAFLRIGTGARAVGMGEAQTAIADSAEAVFWNPAGIGLVKYPEIELMHLSYLVGISYEAGAIVLPIKDFGNLGFGFSYLSSGSMDKTVESFGDYLVDGSFAYTAMLGMLAFASKMTLSETEYLNVGFGLKFVTDTVDTSSVFGAGLDAGVIYNTLTGFYAGAAVLNAGMLFSGSTLLPLTFKAGVGNRFKIDDKHTILGTIDGVVPFETKMKANIGIEYSFDKMIFVRAGYKLNYDIDSFTLGAGFVSHTDPQFELNYAFVPARDDIGLTHRISAGVRFGVPVQKEDKELIEDRIREKIDDDVQKDKEIQTMPEKSKEQMKFKKR
jgi:hypothetical protein